MTTINSTYFVITNCTPESQVLDKTSWNWILDFPLLTRLKSACDDDGESFLWYGWPTKGIQPYFQPGLLSEILTIAKQNSNLCRTWVQALLNEVVQ